MDFYVDAIIKKFNNEDPIVLNSKYWLFKHSYDYVFRPIAFQRKSHYFMCHPKRNFDQSKIFNTLHKIKFIDRGVVVLSGYHRLYEKILKQIDVDTNKSIVKISQEAWEDLLNLSNLNKAGESRTPDLFISWIKASAAHKETEKIIDLFKNNAVDAGNLTLNDTNDAKQNAETNLFYITKKVGDLVIKMNTPNFRTYDSFCILPQTGVGGILGLSFTYSRIDDSTDENRANDYFLGKINHTRYYLNPNPNDNNAYVGLKSHKEKGVNSLIYSPYCMNLTTAYNHNSGERTVGVFTRNSYTIHPLHSPTTPMLFKFTITEA